MTHCSARVPKLHVMDSVLSHLSSWREFRAIVVGDLMLDEYQYGDAERLSADAPVPVLHVRRTERRAGGAGNLCLNLRAMRGEVVALGVVGDDEAGGVLLEELSRAGVEVGGVAVDGSRPTTVKRNLVGLAQQRHPQKMFRVDFESRDPISGEIESSMLAWFSREVRSADVVCIEDYGKGVCTPGLLGEVIRMSRGAGVEVLVDPAMREDASRYRGASAITPNRNEAQRATGLASDEHGSSEVNGRLSGALLESLELEAVVLTLDRHGALVHERGGEATRVPTVAREVYDVTGAGDMMLAGLAAGRANGMTWLDATRFANAAAGLEVEIFGVEAIPLERIHQHLLDLHARERGKVRSRADLLVEVRARRARGERIVLTNGCFDVLHAGHVRLVQEASRMGDFLIVAVNDDASVRRLKGASRPVNSQDDRARVLASLEGVGAVTVFEEDTPIPLLEAIRPDVLVKGGDYSRTGVVGREVVEAYGGRVEIVPAVEGLSTTRTIERMRGA